MTHEPPARWTLTDPDTPFAVLDRATARRNAERLATRLDGLGVTLRPHVKTAKSVRVAQLMHRAPTGPITVSTLREAEEFATAGYPDITYAVGIDPHKLPRVLALAEEGATVRVLLDTLDQAEAVAAASVEAGRAIPALLEVDCDGHRGGVTAQDPTLVRAAEVLARQGCLDGVLVHAGESYHAATADEQRAAAEHERDVAVAAAGLLRDHGLEVITVSVGSTPTAHAAQDLTGVTEVRAGNYVFFDLVMAGLAVCQVEDIALSVVVTVIGHRDEHGWILTDGGWMAMSRDRGTAGQARDQGYGLVTDLDGRVIEELVMSAASQEHGTLTARDGLALPNLPVGTRLRILPNHACATAAQHRGYHVVDGDDEPQVVRDFWPRIHGW